MRVTWKSVGALGALVVVAIAVAALAVSSSAGTLATGKPAHAPSHRLFVLQGASAWTSRNADGSWQITLRGASDVLWFFDRPARGSGHVSAARLAGSWAKLFHGGAPNGAVVDGGSTPDARPTALKVTGLRASAKTGDVVLTAFPEKGETKRDEAWLSRLTKAKAARSGRVSVFLDDTTADGYSQNFRVQSSSVGHGPLTFTPNAAASSCGEPISASPYATIARPDGSTWYQYYLVFDVRETGWRCSFAASSSVWDVYNQSGWVLTLTAQQWGGFSVSCNDNTPQGGCWQEESGSGIFDINSWGPLN